MFTFQSVMPGYQHDGSVDGLCFLCWDHSKDVMCSGGGAGAEAGASRRQRKCDIVDQVHGMMQRAAACMCADLDLDLGLHCYTERWGDGLSAGGGAGGGGGDSGGAGAGAGDVSSLAVAASLACRCRVINHGVCLRGNVPVQCSVMPICRFLLVLW